MISFISSNTVTVLDSGLEICTKLFCYKFKILKETKMSFSGKKFKRVRCENIDELVKASNANENITAMLNSTALTFSFTRIDDNTFNFALQMETRLMSHDFKLGEEHEVERRDGSKVMVTYTLEGDNILKQVIRQPDGKIAHFKREFGETEAKMTIKMEGADVEATIYYEAV